MNTKSFGVGIALLTWITMAGFPAAAQTFSLAPIPPFSGLASPMGFPPDAILVPGPVPIIIGPGPVLGAAPPKFINVDAFAYGILSISSFSPAKVARYEFSVSSFSAPPVGIGAVGAEATTGDHLADIFSSDGLGSNLLMFDGNGVPGPGVPYAGVLGLVEGPGGEDLDAWDGSPVPAYNGPIFFSVDAPSAALAYGAPPFSGAHVFISPFFPLYDAPLGPGVPTPPMAAVMYAPAPALFLDFTGPNTDDIDALVVLDDGDFIYSGAIGVDTVLFSLTPFSPALITPGPYFGATGGDILFANTTGAAGIFIPAPALGLIPGAADIDALDIQIVPVAASITESTGTITVAWSDLVPPNVYTVAVASASYPLVWTDTTNFTATAPTTISTDTSSTNTVRHFLLHR